MPAPITPEALRSAVDTGGETALLHLVRGGPNTPRSEQLARAREVTRLLPSLQLNVQQRRLVIEANRRVLQALANDIAQEMRSSSGPEAAILTTQKNDVSVALQAVLANERVSATPTEAVINQLRDLGNDARNSSRLNQALLVGGGALALQTIWRFFAGGPNEAGERQPSLPRRILNTLGRPFMYAAGFLGLAALWDRLGFGKGKGGLFGGGSSGNTSSQPTNLPANPFDQLSQSQNGPGNGAEVLQPRREIYIRATPHLINFAKFKNGAWLLVEGEPNLLTTPQALRRVRELRLENPNIQRVFILQDNNSPSITSNDQSSPPEAVELLTRLRAVLPYEPSSLLVDSLALSTCPSLDYPNAVVNSIDVIRREQTFVQNPTLSSDFPDPARRNHLDRRLATLQALQAYRVNKTPMTKQSAVTAIRGEAAFVERVPAGSYFSSNNDQLLLIANLRALADRITAE